MKPASRYLLTISILLSLATMANADPTQYGVQGLDPECTQQAAYDKLVLNRCAAMNAAGGYCDPTDSATIPGPIQIGFDGDQFILQQPGYSLEDHTMYSGYYVQDKSGTGIRIGIAYSKASQTANTLVCNGGPSDDSDGDGINDDNDPFPNDDRPFTWKVLMQCDDAQGNPVGWKVEVDNGDGPQVMEIGSINDCQGDATIYPYDQDPKTQDEWGDIAWEGDMNLAGQDETPYYGYDSPAWDSSYDGTPEQPVPGLEYGNPAEPGDSDSTLLEKIVDNTHAQAKNQQKIADQLKAQNERATEGREADQDRNTKLEEINDQLEKIEDQMEGDATIADDGTAQVQSAYDSAYNELQTPMEVPQEYQEKTDIETEVDTRISGSGVLDMITGVGIQASGTCSMETTIYGRQISLTVCNYADELQAWGVILMAMTGLTSILVVFKR